MDTSGYNLYRGYIYLHIKPHLHLIHIARIQVSTCIRIQVARPGYLYPAICIRCKRR